MGMIREWGIKLTDWIFYTSLFAAACTVSLCMGTERLLLRHAPPLLTPLHVFAFGSTLMVYNAHYLVKKSTAASDRQSWTRRFPKWNLICFLLGCALCLGGALYLPLRVLAACPVLAVLSFAYSLPLLPFIRRKRLRDFGWIKITVLTSVWTIVTAALPMLYYQRRFAEYPLELLLRFVFMFVLCVAFDIRDMQTDLEASIYTLPNRIGLKASYRLMYAFLLVFVTLSIGQHLHYPVPGRLVAEIVTAICTGIAIEYTRRYPSDKAYLAFIDGMMLLYGVLMVLH